jgi:hypothetical protein
VATRNAGNTNPARYGSDGIIECMGDGRGNCYWSGTATCQSNINNAASVFKGVVRCTREIQNTPGNWCNDAARALGMPPSPPPPPAPPAPPVPPPQPSPWLCWPPVATRNAGNTNPARYDASGIIECMSPDGANCYWSATAVCQSNIANAATLARSTVKCTRELQNTPGTWCNDAARALGLPPSPPSPPAFPPLPPGSASPPPPFEAVKLPTRKCRPQTRANLHTHA